MTRVLLTGGSGFIAAHVLDVLLKRGHSVVTTVRSEAKAQKIREANAKYGKEKLDFAIVEDIAQLDAFDKAIVSDPPFETVIHTASPFHFNVTDVQKDLLDPAINGTTGILKAIKKRAPTVKRVVITSSFAAILRLPPPPKEHVYSEKDWNPITPEGALENPVNGYRASKTFAERAAWEFVEKEKPNFTLATCNPPFVFGPIVHYLNSLDALNTSNARVRDIAFGGSKVLTPTGTFLWIDVRDLALAHVLAAEIQEAGGKRFFLTAGEFSNKEVAEIIRDNFPDLAARVPQGEALKLGDYPEGGMPYGYDNSRSKGVLGLKYGSLKDCIVDTVKSLQAIGA